MKHLPKKVILIFVFTLTFSIFFLMSCQRKERIYVKPPEEKLDKYATYFKNSANFLDSTYMRFFHKRYNQLLKEGKIDSAAHILMLTGKNLGVNYKKDSVFIRTSLNFMNKYQ